MKWLTQFTGGLLERVFGLTLALCAVQFPVYFAAYCNTLAGAQLEAQTRYQELEREAASVPLSVNEFIQRHESNADAVFRASGRIHRTTIERYRRFTAMQAALSSAPLWARPWVLSQNFDRSLHLATRFEPGLPLSVEGGAYALGGLLLAWLLSSALGWVFTPKPSTAVV